jgi:VanZ family protein
VSGSRAVSVWLPVVAWAAVIFGLSSIPSLGTDLGTWDLVLRKLAHVAEYAVLGALLLRAVGRAAPAFLIAGAYAATDELHQRFVHGRHPSALDVLIDAAGVAIGIALFARGGERLLPWRPTTIEGQWNARKTSATAGSRPSSSGSTGSATRSTP